MTTFWSDQRVVVTGGAGFLGSFVVDELQERGCRDVFVPRSRDYDLRELEGCRRELRESLSDWVALRLKMDLAIPIVANIDLNQLTQPV